MASRSRKQRAAARELGQQAEIDVARDRRGLEEALDLAVLGHIGDAGADRRRGHAKTHRLVVQEDLAAMEEVALQNARDDLERLGPAGADEAEHAGDLAGEDGERIVLHHRRHLEVLHRQHALAGLAHGRLAHAIERMGQVAADHRLDDARAVEFRRVVGDDLLAVAQHGDAIGEQQRLFQRVRDEDDRHAALLQVAHQVEEVFLLLGRQRRGRLVEDDHLGLVQHGAGDLDHLLLGRAERADRRRRRDVEVQRLQELLRGDIDAAQAVVEALLAEKQVLRHRHRRHEAVLLEHHADAEMARLERRLRRDLDSVDASSFPRSA